MAGSRISSMVDVFRILDQHTNYERVSVDYSSTSYSLQRMETFASLLETPHQAYPSIHVAGSKGKGSTCLFLQSIMRKHGLKTGLYTSPHILDIRERIQINQEWISESDMADCFEFMQPALRDMKQTGFAVTYFDLLTMAAFIHFAKQEVDVAIVEVGLGGRLDSTNILHPSVSIITSIQLEHTDKLGKTLTAIASEKAGIIKSGTPLVFGDVSADVRALFEKRCEEFNAPYMSVLAFSESVGEERSNVPARNNAELAWAAAQTFLDDDFDAKLTTKALQETQLPGRQQWVEGSPPMLVDMAHTPDSMQALCKTLELHLKENRPTRKVVVLLAFMRDKDIQACLDPILKCCQHVVTTTVNSPRCFDPKKLADNIEGRVQSVVVESNTVVALEKAKQIAGADGLVCVTGSTYLVGAVLNYIKI